MVRTIEQIGGLQTQYAPSGYVGLWSRLRNFRRDALTRALEQRKVIQGTLLRSTIHMVSPRDYWLFVAAVRQSRREWFLRITRKEFGGLDMERAAGLVRGLLENGPQRADDLKRNLVDSGLAPVSWAGLSAWIDMVRVPPSGTWNQRRADLYALAERWLPVKSHSEAAALEHVVRRYLGGFGPASAHQIADWAGIPAPKLAPVVNRMSLRRFRDESGKVLFDLPRAPLPDESTPAPVRFLPTWDATLLVHARRTQILPEHFRPLIFNTKTPHCKPTFLVDGAVAGTWRHEKDRILVEPFERLSASVRHEVDEEARRLAAFHG
jgi:hypothetical protein